MGKKGGREIFTMFLFSLILSILIHHAYNLSLIYLYEEIVVSEPNKVILLVEMFLVIIAIIYVLHRITKFW